MREQLIFDEKKETPVTYLTRMAPIVGVLRNDNVSDADKELICTISPYELREIENEMCKAFEKTIVTETKRVIRLMSGNLNGFEDDYMNELRLSILKDIHKFNNPAYLETKQTYSVDAFVRARTAGVTKKILGIKRGRKEYEMKRESHVKKIISALERERNSSAHDAWEVWQNQHLANDSMKLSLNQVRDCLGIMEDPAYFEDMVEEEAVYKGKEIEEADEKDIVDDFIKVEGMTISPEYELLITLAVHLLSSRS